MSTPLSGRPLIDEIDEFLRDRGFSTWGQGFSLTKDDDRRQAAEWFAGQIAKFELWRTERDASNGVGIVGADDEAWRRYMESTDEHKIADLLDKLMASESWWARLRRRVRGFAARLRRR